MRATCGANSCVKVSWCRRSLSARPMKGATALSPPRCGYGRCARRDSARTAGRSVRLCAVPPNPLPTTCARASLLGIGRRPGWRRHLLRAPAYRRQRAPRRRCQARRCRRSPLRCSASYSLSVTPPRHHLLLRGARRHACGAPRPPQTPSSPRLLRPETRSRSMPSLLRGSERRVPRTDWDFRKMRRPRATRRCASLMLLQTTRPRGPTTRRQPPARRPPSIRRSRLQKRPRSTLSRRGGCSRAAAVGWPARARGVVMGATRR